MQNSDVVIRVEGLGKKYYLHHEQKERYTSLREIVARQAKAAGLLLNPFTLGGQLRKAQREASQDLAAGEEEFWALKDVSFEIRRGERVGIIGRNGAGKSTLLKILSRITEPTTGRVEIRGRVACLLEVGTGFHPELTGRENIFLNGAILGMSRREIRSKFDEIVAFAEVEKFLDTPVKRYSSGMYVRLAFAVAAHLEPEILVVDEVLAVGDASFQKKCLGKMEDVAEREGRTVLFVSHNIEAIRRLCGRGLYLINGKVHTDSVAEECINSYLTTSKNHASSHNPTFLEFISKTLKSPRLSQVVVGLYSEDGKPRQSFSMEDPITITTIWMPADLPSTARINLHVKNNTGDTVFCSIAEQEVHHVSTNERVSASLRVPSLYLNSGEYFISIYFTSFAPTLVHASWLDAITFSVQDDLPYRLHLGFNHRLPGDVILGNPDWSISGLPKYTSNT